MADSDDRKPINGWWDFGQTLSQIRKELGLSQGAAAWIMGIDQSRLSRLEEKVNSPWRPDQAANCLVSAQEKNMYFAHRLAELLDHTGYEAKRLPELCASKPAT